MAIIRIGRFCALSMVVGLSGCGARSDGPMITADGVRLVPGDDVCVAADVSNDALINLREVPAPAVPMNLVHLAYTQTTVGGSLATTLNVDNSFTRQLLYHAAISVTASSPAMNTDTCPVMPAVTDVELWPQAIAAIVVRDFVFRDGDQPCAYYQ